MGKPSKILFTVIVCVLVFTGGIVTGLQTSFAPAYAAPDKTLESECVKKEKANDIDHFFCVAISGLQQAFGEAGSGIQQIIDLLTNPNFGLEEIKKEVSTIESEVLSEDHGLAEIKTEVRDIETRLASMEEKLDQIQNSLESCPNDCSGNGICQSGVCLCEPGFSGVDCSVPAEDDFCSTASCDDANQCTADSCNETTDTCVYTPVDLGTTSCGVGACFRTVQVCTNGVPNECTPSAPNPEICNSIDDDCDGLVDDNPTDLDTNPVCSSFTPIGTVSGDTGSSIITLNSKGEKWFRFFVSENDDGVFTPHDLGARITLDVPPGTDYDLFAYCDGCGTAPVASSASGPGIQEQVFVRWTDLLGSDSGRFIIVEVRHRLADSCEDYRLTVTGNIFSGPNTCSAR